MPATFLWQVTTSELNRMNRSHKIHIREIISKTYNVCRAYSTTSKFIQLPIQSIHFIFLLSVFEGTTDLQRLVSMTILLTGQMATMIRKTFNGNRTRPELAAK